MRVVAGRRSDVKRIVAHLLMLDTRKVDGKRQDRRIELAGDKTLRQLRCQVFAQKEVEPRIESRQRCCRRRQQKWRNRRNDPKVIRAFKRQARRCDAGKVFRRRDDR